jgi:hypothetical protein
MWSFIYVRLWTIVVHEWGGTRLDSYVYHINPHTRAGSCPPWQKTMDLRVGLCIPPRRVFVKAALEKMDNDSHTQHVDLDAHM